jgi:peptidoglycan/xylan/chitin deacetylase (PgdA/CDA1 family)
MHWRRGGCGYTVRVHMGVHSGSAIMARWVSFGLAGWAVVLALVAAAAVAPSAGARADRLPTSASVIMYHRFGDGRHPSTNTTLEQLDAHLQELKTGGYTVLALTDILARQGAGQPLADKTVGLSIDDAFLSVYRQGWPKLRDAGVPVTLFVATDSVDRGAGDYMSWDQIRDLRDAGVTIGSQTASHPHMPTLSPDALAAELERSNARFEAELGERPALFAYPYGEASLAAAAAVRAAGFVAAFGQHSGAFAADADRFYLPRFAMNESYGDLQRFRTAAQAMAMRIEDFVPPDMTLTQPNPPMVGFTVTHPRRGLGALACYASHQGQAEVTLLAGVRAEVRFDDAMPAGRTRLNCTLPAGGGRWYWFGRQFYVVD